MTSRIPRNFNKEFRWRAKLIGKTNPRFARMWFHYLRGTPATQLLDRGAPVHQVAARIGDDPAVLLRVYAKLTKRPHEGMADAVNALATSFLKN